MSLTLPYPSIVFVPLDVLTAEELNQLNANTQAIANLFPLAASNINTSTFKVNPKFMQVGTGTIEVKPDGSGAGGGPVTFTTPFDNIPHIQLSLQYGGIKLAEASISSIRTTGFTALARHTADYSENCTFYWTAIDMTQPPLIPIES